jgi:tetratricopeptide (TPR) repeat protein
MTTLRFGLRAAALSLLLAWCAHAAAQEAAPPPDEPAPVSDEIQTLYREALQSIAEGRKQDAKEALERVVNREALHAGAWLDLALIHCGLGNRAEAERMFLHIEREFAPPEAILELIAEARATRCDQWQPMSQFLLSAGRGASSNVNQGTTASGAIAGLPVDLPVADEFKPMHDQYTTVTADYWRDLSANGTIGNLQLQTRRYDRLHDYDSASLFGGVDTPWHAGAWTVRGSALVGLISLGGQLYQQQAQLQLRVEPPLALPTGVKFNFGGSVSRADYRTLSNFDSMTRELRSHLSYRDRDNYVGGSVSYLQDRARGDRPGGDRSGWLLNTSWRHNLPANVTSELGYSRQNWNGTQYYTPGFIDVVRDQVTHVWRGSLSYPLSPRQSLLLDARIVHNNENIKLFQYTDRQLQLSWQWQL